MVQNLDILGHSKLKAVDGAVDLTFSVGFIVLFMYRCDILIDYIVIKNHRFKKKLTAIVSKTMIDIGNGRN